MRLVSFLCLISVAIVCIAQNESTPQRQPGPGSVSDRRYVNEALGIAYPLPAGDWVVNESSDRRSFPNGTFLLLMADRHSGKRFFDRLLLIVDDTSHYSNLSTPKDYVRRLVAAQTKVKGVDLVHDAYSENVNGRQFSRSDFKETSADASIYKAYIATRFRGWFVSWVFASDSPAEIDKLAESVRATSFQSEISERTSSSLEPPNAGDTCPALKPEEASDHPIRVRISEKVSQVLVCKQVPPVYPEEARRSRVQGHVVLQVLITDTGDVSDIKVISGDRALASSAVESVRQWRYKPYVLNGKRAEAQTQVTVEFCLN